MSTYANTKLQELRGSILEFAKGKARRVVEALGDDNHKYPQVDIPKDRAAFLQSRADYWANAMHIETLQLQFREGLQDRGHATGCYWEDDHVIVIDADVAKSDYKHLDTLIAHEMGHAADREIGQREWDEVERFAKKAVIAGLALGAGIAATTTLPIVPAFLSGLLVGLFASKVKSFMSHSSICLRQEVRANNNVLDAGMPRGHLLQMYACWRKPDGDGTFYGEYDKTIITAIEEYEGKQELLKT